MADTIFALSSGRLPSAIAVVRLSGPQSRFAVETITESVPEPRRLFYSVMRGKGGVIDRGMAIFFPRPGSSTGEDCAEFHLHGSRPAVALLFEALQGLGCRLAEPGEFTRRAFLNGKLDLVQAEAVADLVAADTEAQRRFAATALEGAASSLYAGWRVRLLHARAMIEAELDFSDESDVPGSVAGTVWDDMARLGSEIAAHTARFRQAEIVREGFEVVILGAPNAGKSSLLNALAARDVAIVSEEAGTTRDLIEVQLDLGGLKIRLVDTAGLRAQAESPIERIGMERARHRAERANLVLMLHEPGPVSDAIGTPAGVETITIRSKADLRQDREADGGDLLVSVRTGEGLGDLLHLLRARAEAAVGSIGDVMPSRERHVGHLGDAARHIGNALAAALPIELRAEELRLAGVALGRITGDISTEEVLGAIFSRFCIGK